MKLDAMKRISGSIQMQQLLTRRVGAGLAGDPVHHFVARAADFLLKVSLKQQIEASIGRRPYARGSGDPALVTERVREAHAEDRGRVIQGELNPLIQKVFLAPDHRAVEQ